MLGSTYSKVFVDAHVLYSRTIRDWLGLLTTRAEFESPFQVCWSEDVLAEAVHSLRKANPTWDGAQIQAIRDQVAATFVDGLVREFTVDGTFPGSDPHDAHVHAATVACGAGMLVSTDAGFASVADELPYDVLLPDEFLCAVDDTAPALVAVCVAADLEYWGKRSRRADLVGAARRAGCPAFAARIKQHLREMALRD